MAKLSDIYSYFEASFTRGILVTASISLHFEEPLPLMLVKWDSKRPFFQAAIEIPQKDQKRKTEVVKEIKSFYLQSEEEITIEPIDPPSFNYLYWLLPSHQENKYELHYMECGTVTPLDSLDIAVGDSFNASTRRKDIEHLNEIVQNIYVFDAGVYQLMFIKPFKNGSLDWDTFGLQVDREGLIKPIIGKIALTQNKKGEPIREIVEEFSKKQVFMKRIEDAEILAYTSIQFVKDSAAKAAKDNLSRKKTSGNAILGLWEKYNKIEYLRAVERSNELGNVAYEIIRRGINGSVSVKLNLTTSQKDVISNIAGGNPVFSVVGSMAPVKMTSYNSNMEEAIFEDEDYQLPANGKLHLSVQGELTVKQRRERALTNVFLDKNCTLMNLHFAIEGEVDSMIVKNPRDVAKSLTRTKAFLKRRFHIDSLTKNQEEAVKMALNNEDDITVIQGPPGTGKTTVIAAICYRLLEIAEKRRVSRTEEKAILASAFQNDATEHMSSKIYSYGLPTPKVGQNHSGVSAEGVFIDEKIKHISEVIEKLGGRVGVQKSTQLMQLHELFIKEEDYEHTISVIDELLRNDTSLPAEQYDSWLKIRKQQRQDSKLVKRLTEALDSVKTDMQSYNFEDGFTAAYSLKNIEGFEFTSEDIKLLDSAPEMDPEETYLKKLSNLKFRLQDQISKISVLEESRRKNDLANWIRSSAEIFQSKEQEDTESEDRFIQSVLTELENDLRSNSQYIKRALMDYSETIAATNQKAGSLEMSEYSIRNVILDEAARSNPLDLLIPMSRAQDRIILVGDQKQLPHLLEPTLADMSLDTIEDIDKRKESKDMFAMPLFGIIFDNLSKGKRPRRITLNEQFRMHPQIGDFISEVYYEGVLQPGRPREVMSLDKQHGLSLPWAIGKTFVFCHIGHNNDKNVERGRSKFRVCEAVKAIQLLKEIESDPAFMNLSVGIISFYAKQVETIYAEAEKFGYAYRRNGEYVIAEAYQELPDGREKLRIGSVDAFQGKEFDIVILSTVRSNDIPREPLNVQRVFGFLTIPNRLNVAFSRAQRMVITIGDENMYKDEYAKENVPGLYKLCNEIIPLKEYGSRIE